MRGGFIPFISSFYLTLQDILFIGRLVGGFLLAEGAVSYTHLQSPGAW